MGSNYQKMILKTTLSICCLLTSSVTAASRPLEEPAAVLLGQKDSGSSNNCWDSLFELQSCTGEVVLFFLNGETYLGPNCCRAIRIIENQCWPSMLGSVGINPQEGDILLGYCDAAASSAPAPPPSSASPHDQAQLIVN